MDPIRALLVLIGIILLALSPFVEKHTEVLWRVGWACLATAYFLPLMKAGL